MAEARSVLSPGCKARLKQVGLGPRRAVGYGTTLDLYLNFNQEPGECFKQIAAITDSCFKRIPVAGVRKEPRCGATTWSGEVSTVNYSEAWGGGTATHGPG